MNLQSLSSSSLHEKLLSLSAAERRLTLELLHHLREFDRRRLYADRGHSSLFSYVVEELKYSESAAQRRISAMRALRDLPEMEEKVESGELKVTQLAQIQTFIRMEEKQGKRVTLEEKRELVEATLGKSTRDTEKLLAEKNPEIAFREKTRSITATHTQITFTVDEELMKDLESVRDRFAHQLPPGASVADILRFLAGRALKSTPENRPSRGRPDREPIVRKVEPDFEKSSSTESVPPLPAPVVASRYIPASVRKTVWTRDAGRCAYLSKETGRICGSRHRLQIDHRHPHALGGENTPENLRLLCATHNGLEARRVFGEVIQGPRPS